MTNKIRRIYETNLKSQLWRNYTRPEGLWVLAVTMVSEKIGEKQIKEDWRENEKEEEDESWQLSLC